MIHIQSTPIKKFTHIIHAADIHIRLNKRHDEYKEVFSKFYDEIRLSPPETVVVLAGDIFHSKSDLSPECVQMAVDLFKNIADMRPLVIIAGNHDATLSNKNRLDSLTPVVDAVNHPNLYYFKTTGLYGFGNILFNNMCVFDPPDKYIRGSDIPAIYKNQYEHIIALFHGAIDGASTDTGYRLMNPSIMTPLFDDHHIALCGDIHLKQDLQDYDADKNKPCVRYPSSLVQQNHGESISGHGYSLWDLSTHLYEHREINNNYGYFTIEVNKGQLTTDLTGLPKNVRLRIKCFESIATEVKAVISKIKEMSQVVEIAYVRMDQERDKKDIIPLCKDIVLTDLTSVDYQNRLITEFLQKKLDITDTAKLDDILKINRETNLLIKRDDFTRNLQWKPIRFEFDNMFTYGEGNVIDFTQMHGIYGIFGPNKHGKSSILSAIIFCLFDKFDRGFKGVHVLNVQKTSFKCKLEFEISGERYFIERKGSTTRAGNVKVDVRFWKIVAGKEEELHGTARRDTNDIIRDYVGTYEDFVLTAASFQTAKNNSSFIDMGNSERKDLLVQFIGLNVFDRLHEAGSERNKEINSLLKLHKDKNYLYDIGENNLLLKQTNSNFEDATAMVESLKKQLSGVNEQIVVETGNLIRLDVDVPTNLSLLESKKTAADVSAKTKETALNQYRTSLTAKELVVDDIKQSIAKIEESDLVTSHATYKLLKAEINELNQGLDIKKIEVKSKLEKSARLDSYEYDPNCKFCINNDFVKDATSAKTELLSDKIEVDAILVKLENKQSELAKVQWAEKVYETYTRLLTELGKAKDECSVLSRNIIIATNEFDKLEIIRKNITQQIEIYNRNKISVEANEIVHSNITSYRKVLEKLNSEFEIQHNLLIEIVSKRESLKHQIEQLTIIMTEIQKLEKESESYQNYLAAVGRDGIPYQVICNTVPEIEREVNSILSQVVDYTIQFETDGKNVTPYVVYDYGRWAIELTSGYERFVASIAIRVALTEISNLPKISALFIDEGFGTLDPDNLASMFVLFTFLKNNYDFVWVISHLSALKDAVDKTIDITREGNFSRVVVE